MNKKKTILIVVAVVVLFAIIISVYLIFNKSDDSVNVKPDTTSATSVTTTPTEVTTEVTTTTYPPYVNGLSLKAQEAHNTNADTVGWIRISNTVIDYPIVRAAENDFYVTNNFDKLPDPAGWTFMDFRCRFDADYSTDNLLLYGHNMADGTMFSDLKNYLRDETFYEANPIVEMSSLYADYQYKIFAFMLCDGTYGSDFEFWNYTVFSKDKNNPAWTLDEYLSKINDKSLITTNVDVKEDDDLLLMSTCNTGDVTDSTRFVVLARRVRPGEDAYAGTTGSTRR